MTLIMGTGLSFRYRFSGDLNDDFGWLEVKEFGDKLAIYPILPDAPIEASWGYEPWEGDSLVVSVEVAPADTRGNLSVQVWPRDHTEMGEGKPTNCVRPTFKANYPELERFRHAIAQLMGGESEEAVLVGQ